MKSKVIFLVLLSSIFLGSVRANGATVNNYKLSKIVIYNKKDKSSVNSNMFLSKKQNNTNVSSEKFMLRVEEAIFNKVNEERAKAKIPALAYNSTMEKYARIKSQDMGDKNYFSHRDLNGNYITSKMKADGVFLNAWGENIAYIEGVSEESVLAEQFMKNWMNSEGHKKNILSKNFKSIGIGVYKVGNKVYATQEFYK